MTTDIMVIQKNRPGHEELSAIANTTVSTNIATCVNSPPTIRAVKLSLYDKEIYSYTQDIQESFFSMV